MLCADFYNPASYKNYIVPLSLLLTHKNPLQIIIRSIEKSAASKLLYVLILFVFGKEFLLRKFKFLISFGINTVRQCAACRAAAHFDASTSSNACTASRP